MYRKAEDGTFYIDTPWGEERVGRAVAILFDAKEGTLLSHGAPAQVQEAHERMVKAPLGADLVLFENACWEPEFLDQLVHTSGLVGRWWQHQVRHRYALVNDGLARC